MSSSPMRINWSHRFELTPLEHKRLRAIGLTDKEVFGVANAARLSGRDVDEITQMVLRGRSFPQIATELRLSYAALDERRPEWETAEWDQAVREGWYTHRPVMSTGSSMGTSGSGSSSR